MHRPVSRMPHAGGFPPSAASSPRRYHIRLLSLYRLTHLSRGPAIWGRASERSASGALRGSPPQIPNRPANQMIPLRPPLVFGVFPHVSPMADISPPSPFSTSQECAARSTEPNTLLPRSWIAPRLGFEPGTIRSPVGKLNR